MTTFGAAGITFTRQDEDYESLKARAKVAFGNTLRDDTGGQLMRVFRILSELLGGNNDLLAYLLLNMYPSTSVGLLCDEWMKFYGLTRNQQRFSTVTLSLTVNTAGSTVPAGSLVQTTTGVVFATDSETVLAPSETKTDVAATAVVAGALAADAGTITEILTPVYGWESVTNAAAATVGRTVETDPAARARMARAARGVGLHHVSRIKTRLEDLPDVTAVNVSDSSAGVRAIVRGGDSADIAAVLFGSYADPTTGEVTGAGSVAAGIPTLGSTLVHVVDSDTGQEGDIRFDRSTDVDIYIVVQLQRIPGAYPSNGDETMKAKIVELFEGDLEIEGAFVEGMSLGEDVYASRIYAATSAVPGHIVRNIFIGTSPNPTSSSDIAISDMQLATTATNLITIQGV